MKKLFVLFICLICLFGATDTTEAKKVNNSTSKGKIVFIPHDNRPVSDEMAADTVRKLGYEVIVPPDDLLGNKDNMGNPENLWMWLETNTTVKRSPSKLEQKRFHLLCSLFRLMAREQIIGAEHDDQQIKRRSACDET